jgi:hypothetical protein
MKGAGGKCTCGWKRVELKNQIAKTFGEKTSVKELSSAGGGYRRGGRRRETALKRQRAA